MKYHFISGLPRSGSTLLSAILRQNPRFHAGMTSPVTMLVNALLRQMSAQNEFSCCFGEDRRRDILRSVVSGYYAESKAEVVFDTNRTWTGKMALLSELFPEAKVICCVRDVGMILESIERLLRRNPLQTSRLFDFKPDTSVYSRKDVLMNPETGMIGVPWGMLREAWYGPLASSLVIVEYDRLVAQPGAMMRAIYQAIGEPEFAHNFEDVNYDEPEFDAAIGMPGLHRVSGPVRASTYPGSVPPDLLALYEPANFWRESKVQSEEFHG